MCEGGLNAPLDLTRSLRGARTRCGLLDSGAPGADDLVTSSGPPCFSIKPWERPRFGIDREWLVPQFVRSLSVTISWSRIAWEFARPVVRDRLQQVFDEPPRTILGARDSEGLKSSSLWKCSRGSVVETARDFCVCLRDGCSSIHVLASVPGHRIAKRNQGPYVEACPRTGGGGCLSCLEPTR